MLYFWSSFIIGLYVVAIKRFDHNVLAKVIEK